jgi:hypothetical protein
VYNGCRAPFLAVHCPVITLVVLPFLRFGELSRYICKRDSQRANPLMQGCPYLSRRPRTPTHCHLNHFRNTFIRPATPSTCSHSKWLVHHQLTLLQSPMAISSITDLRRRRRTIGNHTHTVRHLPHALIMICILGCRIPTGKGPHFTTHLVVPENNLLPFRWHWVEDSTPSSRTTRLHQTPSSQVFRP